MPIFLPISSPAPQTANVTAEMISEAASAAAQSYAAIVKPTESASMDVATPCRKSAPGVSRGAAQSSRPPRSPSSTILPPIPSSRISAIQGTAFWKERKISTMVRTQTQPVIGISAWKKAYTPATAHPRRTPMRGSFSPLTIDTEKASIDSPTPSSAQFSTNMKLKLISATPS